LLSYEKMMEIMEQPKYARVAKSFVTEDRSEAVFLLRMVENRREKLRLEVVDDLRLIARKHGFKPALVGSIYYLQGRLAKLVASSLVTGLFWLNFLFIVIAWIVARSIRGAVAMIVSLTLVPLCMLGGIGWLHVPVDIISAPATNVCIGIAIDSMIHLVFGVRRAQRDGTKGGRRGSRPAKNNGAGSFTPTSSLPLASPSSYCPIFRRPNASVSSFLPAASSTSWQTSSYCRYSAALSGKRSDPRQPDRDEAIRARISASPA
jgi:predicted RND superfamily exporter protein